VDVKVFGPLVENAVLGAVSTAFPLVGSCGAYMYSQIKAVMAANEAAEANAEIVESKEAIDYMTKQLNLSATGLIQGMMGSHGGYLHKLGVYKGLAQGLMDESGRDQKELDKQYRSAKDAFDRDGYLEEQTLGIALGGLKAKATRVAGNKKTHANTVKDYSDTAVDMQDASDSIGTISKNVLTKLIVAYLQYLKGTFEFPADLSLDVDTGKYNFALDAKAAEFKYTNLGKMDAITRSHFLAISVGELPDMGVRSNVMVTLPRPGGSTPVQFTIGPGEKMVANTDSLYRLFDACTYGSGCQDVHQVGMEQASMYLQERIWDLLDVLPMGSCKAVIPPVPA
jgi:hypothetical protein